MLTHADVTPRFAAFMRANGFATLDDWRATAGHGASFITWNSARLRDFLRERGVQPHTAAAAALIRGEYDAWLDATFPMTDEVPGA